MAAPRVSVLMATRDRGERIGASVASVLAQRFEDLELIVVDDGSRDDTAARLAAVGDPRLRVLRQEPRGINAALNVGLAAARGALVARNDSDDLWLPHLLGRLVPALEARPEMGFVYARSEGVDDEGRPVPELRGYPMRHPDDPLRSLLHVDCTSAITLLARRRCLERIGGWGEETHLHGDWEMAIRAAGLCGGFFVDELVARFRIHPGNATRIDELGDAEFEALLESRRQVLDRVFGCPELGPAAAPHRGTAYRNLYIGEGNRWLGRGDRRRALTAFRMALRSGDGRLGSAARIVWGVAAWYGLSNLPGGTRFARALLTRWRGRGRLRGEAS